MESDKYNKLIEDLKKLEADLQAKLLKKGNLD